MQEVLGVLDEPLRVGECRDSGIISVFPGAEFACLEPLRYEWVRYGGTEKVNHAPRL